VVAYDGSRVITGSVDGVVRVWTLEPKPPEQKPRRKKRSVLQHEIMLQRRFEVRSLPSSTSYSTPYVSPFEDAQSFLAC
jgi:hypothetical protein